MLGEIFPDRQMRFRLHRYLRCLLQLVQILDTLFRRSGTAERDIGKYFEGFLSGASRISRVWGRHSPTRFPQGQNERKANFGTAVESCSKKLPDCHSLPTATFSENRNQLFYKRLPDCPHLLLPLF